MSCQPIGQISQSDEISWRHCFNGLSDSARRVLEQSGTFGVTLVDDEDLPALKQKLGVPIGFGSCHTGVVEGYVVEGHMPAEDILRLLAGRPAGVRGLVVPGMPRGSPSMEQPDGSRDAYDVFAFKADGSTSVFAHHE